MITVRPVNGLYVNGYHVEGHAGQAPHGQDIVCSAVSALAQTTMMALERNSAIDAEVQSGDMRIEVKKPNKYTHLLIESMMNGLYHIERAYTQYIHIEKENVHERQNQRLRARAGQHAPKYEQSDYRSNPEEA